MVMSAGREISLRFHAVVSSIAMATQAQYDFFKQLFELEEQRYANLQMKAKFFLGAASAVVAAVTLKLPDVLTFVQRFRVDVSAVILIGIGMTVAIVCSIAAMTIAHYDRVADPERIIRSFGDDPPADDDFRDDRIVDYAVATNVNFKTNNRTATYLQVAGWAVVSSTIAQVGVLLWAIATEVGVWPRNG